MPDWALRDLERMGVLNKEKNAVRESYVLQRGAIPKTGLWYYLSRKQNRFFELFYGRYRDVVQAAQQAGAFDFGVEEIRARNLRSVGQAQTLFVDVACGARTTLHELEGEVGRGAAHIRGRSGQLCR